MERRGGGRCGSVREITQRGEGGESGADHEEKEVGWGEEDGGAVEQRVEKGERIENKMGKRSSGGLRSEGVPGGAARRGAR
jgi:hypothetical protein